MVGYIGLKRLALGSSSLTDATLLTEALLTALGFTYTRTGEVFGRQSPGGPGNYVRHGANEPEFDFTEVDGKNYPSLIVRGAATPLISYSADLTNAAWTKTNCTAELVTGSLESAATPNGHSLVTATANNATVTRQLTRASANRNTRWKIKAPSTNSGDVLVSHGEPTGSPLYVDNFASDTSGDWTAGVSVVDGTLDGSGGNLVYTIGANDTAFPRHYLQVTGLTVGKFYRAIGTVGGTASTAIVRISRDSVGNSYFGDINVAVTSLTFQAKDTDVYFILMAGTAVGATVTADNLGLYEVDEIVLTPGTFHDIELGEWIGGNPKLAIRLTDNGDTVEHYDVQMAELTAGTPVPNFVPQGATPAATGFANLPRTIGSVPDGVDVELLVKITHKISANQFVLTVFRSGADYWAFYKLSNSDNFAMNNRVGSVSNNADGFGVTLGSTALLRIRHSGTTVSWWKDGVAEADDEGLAELADTLQTLYLGSYPSALAFANPIIAFRDLSGSLLGTPGAGFNISAIERYEASL